MVANYPARQKTGNRAKDVANPMFKEAEERVLRWLLANGYAVRDARGEKTFYDFRFGAFRPVYALDVKCDQFAQTTGRVAWEAFVEMGTHIREGWGRDERLDYIAFVTPGNWHMYLVDAERVREMLVRMEKGFDLPKDGELVEFKKMGSDGRTGYGLAIGLEWMRRMGAIKKEDSLEDILTPEV